MDELSVIQAYLKDINSALRNSKEEDIMILFEELYDKEQKFAKRLRSTGNGRKVYNKFIKKISDGRGGMKMARSYFRARQESFLNTVNKAIREFKPKLMYDVPVNYRFCLFAMESLEVKDQMLGSLFLDIKNLRDEIINKHLFLSLNRAKLFKENSYGSFSEFEDIIQIANEALVIAVDKYVIDDDSSTFHSMAIGRIISNLIENGETTSPVELGGHAKKKLYRIRKMLQKNPDFSTKEISDILKIAEDEVVDLIGSTKHSSLDDFVGDDSEARVGETFTTEEQELKENQLDHVEKHDLLSVLYKNLDVLSVMERKVLKLKGVLIDENDQ